MCYQVEKMVKENEGKLQDSDREPLDAAIAKVREAAKGVDTDAIKSAVKELEQASHAMSAAMYANASETNETPETAGATANAGDTAGSEDDAIDAEFEVKD